jgi:hypothetical protein
MHHRRSGIGGAGGAGGRGGMGGVPTTDVTSTGGTIGGSGSTRTGVGGAKTGGQAGSDASDARPDVPASSDAQGLAALCTSTGGRLETGSCCASVGDFPEMCAAGACTCSPINSHPVTICACPIGSCFSSTVGCSLIGTGGASGAGGTPGNGGAPAGSGGAVSGTGGAPGTGGGGTGTGGAPASASFTDPLLEGTVRDALAQPTGPILLTDVARITKVEANGRGIANLAGIEQLTGLTTLRLNENAITDLGPLAPLTQLSVLELLGNTITDIRPLAPLTNLYALVLGRNATRSTLRATTSAARPRPETCPRSSPGGRRLR